MSTTSRATRRVAAGAAGALVAGLATVAHLPAPAQAAPATGALTWNISQNFVEHLYFSKTRTLGTTPTGSVSGGATHAAGDPTTGADDLFTFPAASATRAADGTLTSTYSGTVRGAFVVAGTEYYSVTLSDPAVVVTPSGAGEIRATVTGTDPSVTTPATEVTVARFSGATSVGGTVEATPDWAGVLAPGSEQATALGISNTEQPVAGKSFAPEFLGAIPTDVRAHFYFSGSGDHKRPAPFAATSTMTPTVTATVTDADPVDGVTVEVRGEGFTAVTNPGDAGVYVAFAPADTVIDYSDRSSLGSIPAVSYVTPRSFDGDRFTTVLGVPTEKLVRGTEYALFTWQAHTRSNDSQDTRTPVAIDWGFLDVPAPSPSATPTPTATPSATPTATPTPTTAPAPAAQVKPHAKAKLRKAPTTRRAGKVAVQVRGRAGAATGKVTAALKVPGRKKAVTLRATLDGKGRAVVRLPKGKRGAYRLVVRFTGDDRYTKVRKVVRFRVTR